MPNRPKIFSKFKLKGDNFSKQAKQSHKQGKSTKTSLKHQMRFQKAIQYVHILYIKRMKLTPMNFSKLLSF